MKTMLITGGGSLCDWLVKYFYHEYKITVLLRDEGKLWRLRQDYKNLDFIFHDLQFDIDKDYGSFDVVLHCAAMKSIETEQYNKLAVWRCNIIGTYTILDYCEIYSPACRFVYAGTDKSINYINYYAQTKSKAEEAVKGSKLNSAIVRMGNLWGSSCSLVPVLALCKKRGDKEFNISSEDSERYFLTEQDTVKLFEKAIKGNEKYYVGRYKIVKIKRLVEIALPGVKINVVGLRPGEKEKEELDINYEAEYYTDSELKNMWEEYYRGEK